MVTTTKTSTIPEHRFDPDVVRPSAALWERNGAQSPKGSHDERCALCNRPMANYNDQKGTASVHMDTDGLLIEKGSADDNDEFLGSMGGYSVGSECAKKIPAAFKVRR